MTQHLFATIVTPTAVAANNRGEGDGSTLSTLQKITRGNDQYTTVSAEAIPEVGELDELQTFVGKKKLNMAVDSRKSL